jgi:hypothetical protein
VFEHGKNLEESPTHIRARLRLQRQPSSNRSWVRANKPGDVRLVKVGALRC